MTHKLQNNYTKEILALLKKVLGPTTDFPTWGSDKGTENPQGIWLWGSVGFDYRTYTGLGKQTLGGHKQNLAHTRTQEKGPTWTSGSSRFTYCWSLAWRMLIITLLACEMNTTVHSLSILWHCLSLGLEWRLTFSSPMATAEFSKFVSILSAAPSQHHLLGFEIAQVEFHHFH